MKFNFIFLFSFLFLQFTLVASAQEERAPKYNYRITETESIFKDHYKIDVFVALNLDEIDERTFRNPRHLLSSKRHIVNFIEGIELAVDSLEQLEIPVEVYIHDLNGNDYFSDETFVEQLESSDLILVHAGSQDVRNISNFALEKEIVLISTFSPSDAGIENNPYFFLLNPKLNAHIDQLLNYSQKYFSNDIHFYLYETSSQFAKRNHEQFNESLGTKAVHSFDWNAKDVQEIIKNNLVPNRRNVFYTNFMEGKFINEFFDFLATFDEEYEVIVMAMPNWRSIIFDKSQDYSAKFYYTQAFHYNEYGNMSFWIKNKYKEEYKKEVNELVYRGFELVFTLARELEKQGHYIEKSMIESDRLWPMSNYFFQSQYDQNNNFLYYENKFLYTIQHQNKEERVMN